MQTIPQAYLKDEVLIFYSAQNNVAVTPFLSVVTCFFNVCARYLIRVKLHSLLCETDCTAQEQCAQPLTRKLLPVDNANAIVDIENRWVDCYCLCMIKRIIL